MATFDGFRSRWTNPRSCAASSAFGNLARASRNARLCIGRRAAAQPMLERLAFDKLEHQRAHAIDFLDAVDGGDAGMIERPRAPGLRARIVRAARGRRRTARGSTLSATSRPSRVIPRAIHLAHAACAKPATDIEMGRSREPVASLTWPNCSACDAFQPSGGLDHPRIRGHRDAQSRRSSPHIFSAPGLGAAVIPRPSNARSSLEAGGWSRSELSAPSAALGFQSAPSAAYRGEWTADTRNTWRGDDGEPRVQFNLRTGAGDSRWGFGVRLRDLAGLPPAAVANMANDVQFTWTREAGTFRFNGSFDQGRGSGTYTFTQDQTFVNNMAGAGYKNLTDRRHRPPRGDRRHHRARARPGAGRLSQPARSTTSSARASIASRRSSCAIWPRSATRASPSTIWFAWASTAPRRRTSRRCRTPASAARASRT